MPRYYTWNVASKNFQRRKKGDAVAGFADVYSTDSLGQIYTVHPSQDECLIILNIFAYDVIYLCVNIYVVCILYILSIYVFKIFDY